MSEVSIHPFAESFPMLSELELDRLAASIKENGLRQPITKRKKDGVILDGRNRLEACRIAGVAPRFETLDFTEEQSLVFIADLNIERRHMNESQRGVAAAEYADRLVEARKVNSELKPDLAIIAPPKRGPKDRGVTEAIKESATKFNVATGTVKKARKVRTESPELASKVQTGEITLNAAEKIIKSTSDKPTSSKPKQKKKKQEKGKSIDCSSFDAIAAELGKIRRRISDLSKSPVGAFINFKSIGVDIDNAKRSLSFAKPVKVCCYCNSTDVNCKSCHGLGWITEAIYSQAPENLKGSST